VSERFETHSHDVLVIGAGGPRHKVWQGQSWLNEHHMGWAWWSLFFVCAADAYVRACSMGLIQDMRLM